MHRRVVLVAFWEPGLLSKMKAELQGNSWIILNKWFLRDAALQLLAERSKFSFMCIYGLHRSSNALIKGYYDFRVKDVQSWSRCHLVDVTAQLDSGTSHTENQVKFSCISLIYQFFIFTTNTLSSFSVWYTLKYFYTQTFVCLWKCLLIFVTLFGTCCTLFVQLLSPCLLANWQDFLCTIFTGEKNQTNLKFYMIVLGWKELLGLRCRQGVREGMFKKKGTWK